MKNMTIPELYNLLCSEDFKNTDFAFYWCRNIEEIILPDTIEYIGRYAFPCCI